MEQNVKQRVKKGEIGSRAIPPPCGPITPSCVPPPKGGGHSPPYGGKEMK